MTEQPKANIKSVVYYYIENGKKVFPPFPNGKFHTIKFDEDLQEFVEVNNND